MNAVSQQAVDVFVAAGLIAADLGVLPDALNELTLRLDLVAGPLLDQLVALEFTAKGDPKPVPTPKPPPPPKPTPKGQA